MYELEALFDRTAEPERIRPGTLGYRVRTIRSGSLVEVEAFPIYRRQDDARRGRGLVTREAQRKVNLKNSIKRMQRKLECNFGTEAVFLTLTYDKVPDDPEKELDRYLAKLRYRAKKAGKDLKYVGVTEISSKGRVHHHFAIEGVDRETCEKLWPYGYSQARRYQDRPGGWGGLSHYMLKARETQERFACRRFRASHNLREPVVTVSDHRISARKMERIAEDARIAGKEIIEKIYPGCGLEEDIEIHCSEYMPGAYLYAKLRKRE